jgi:hypothetical protein
MRLSANAATSQEIGRGTIVPDMALLIQKPRVHGGRHLGR